MVTICSFCGKNLTGLEDDERYKDSRFVICKGCGIFIPKGAKSYHNKKYYKEGSEMADEKEKKPSRRGAVIEVMKSGLNTIDEITAKVQEKMKDEPAGKIKASIRQVIKLVKTDVINNYELEEKEGKFKLSIV